MAITNKSLTVELAMFDWKHVIISLATAAALTSVVGCAADSSEAKESDEPVEVAIENANETTPNWVTYGDCARGWLGGLFGVPDYYHLYYYGPPMTNNECTTWCAGTCGRSSGALNVTTLNNRSGGFYMCTCY